MFNPLKGAKKQATYEEYNVVKTVSGKIEVKQVTRWIEEGDVRHHLRKLAMKLRVSINTDKGVERTTRQLGNAVIKKIQESE